MVAAEFSSAVAALYPEMLVAFHDSLTAAQAAVPSSSELRHVDAVFETALPLLQRHLSSIERVGWKVGVGGAFVHGGNRYQANSAVGNCEIADLLVVVEVARPPSSARTALLLQAKKPMAWPSRPWDGTSGETQRAFFEERPPFTWRPDWVARYYPGLPRTLECGSHGWAAEFENTSWADPRAVFAVLLHPRPWTVPPEEPLAEPVLLSALLADLVRFHAGHPFDRLAASYADPSNLQWSAVIWDVLQSSLNRAHYRETVPDRDSVWTLEDEGPAGEGYVAMDARMRERDAPARIHDGGSDDEGFAGGISVVRIVFTAADGER